MTIQYVILNEVKNPLEADQRQRTWRIAREEILRVAQDDKQYIILNEVKNPLKADKRQRTQRIASEEILRFTHDDKQYVILNEVKNPKVCETVECSTNLEILRVAQDDRVWRGDPSRCSG